MKNSIFKITNIKSEQLFTKAKPKRIPGKIIQFPLTRIIIVPLFFIPLFILNNIIAKNIIQPSPEPYATLLRYIQTILFFILFLIVYRLYTRYIEKRKAYEITLKSSFREFGFGFIIGAGLVNIIVIILSILGYYKIDSFNSWEIIIGSLFIFVMLAFIEELFFRVIIFKLTEELLGSWIAIFIQVIIFGFAHSLNENSTLFTSLAVVIGASILYVAAYMYTRRVWLVLGIHMSWNYFQAGIFGMPNSGQSFDSWINPKIIGPEWITGGNFGVEASLIAVLLGLAMGLFVLKKAINKNQVVLPIWKRK